MEGKEIQKVETTALKTIETVPVQNIEATESDEDNPGVSVVQRFGDGGNVEWRDS